MIIVVNYNQVTEIGQFLEALSSSWQSEGVLVVDDGSTDSSAKIAEELGFEVRKHEINRGVGAAIRTGLQEAVRRNYRAAVIMSSNGKMRPDEIEELIEPLISARADYVTGSRYLKYGSSPGLPLFRKLTIPVVSAALGIFLGRFFSDITCGYRAYRLDFLADPRVNIDQHWLNKYEMEYYLHYWACRLNLKIEEVPVTIHYDHLDKKRLSKIRPFSGWWSMLRPIILLSLRIKK